MYICTYLKLLSSVCTSMEHDFKTSFALVEPIIGSFCFSFTKNLSCRGSDANRDVE